MKNKWARDRPEQMYVTTDGEVIPKNKLKDYSYMVVEKQENITIINYNGKQQNLFEDNRTESI